MTGKPSLKSGKVRVADQPPRALCSAGDLRTAVHSPLTARCLAFLPFIAEQMRPAFCYHTLSRRRNYQMRIRTVLIVVGGTTFCAALGLLG